MKVWTSAAGGWVGVCLAVVAVLAVVRFVDLSPRVEGEFFFSDDDPQMEASRSVARDFPAGAQIVLRVADLGSDTAQYRASIVDLTADLLAVDGIGGGFSITTDDPTDSPLFGRILLTPDPNATNIILQVGAVEPVVLLPRVEEVVARHVTPDFQIVMSGVPVIVELIRRSLYRDLIVFSSAATVVFALLVGLVYRDAAVVVGTLATCFVSVGITLLLVQAMQVGIGLLTANLVTIVFVLTLSHVVFLTGNWRNRVSSNGPVDRARAIREARADTWEGSFWSMATTLLGFASLLVATARPLRELGTAGAVGAAVAMATTYLVYPLFLGRWASVAKGSTSTTPSRPMRGHRWVPALAGLVVLAIGTGLPRINTDPGLLTYFAEGSPLREGLRQIDADGGSSTLDVVVSDPDGASVASPVVYPRLEALQTALEDDPAVGVVLSPTLLIDHARTIPFAGLLPVGMLLDLASTDALNGVGRGFVTPERDRARFSLRMRETGGEPRGRVMDRLRGLVVEHGLRPDIVAGLYDLQAQLGRLIRESLRIGIGGLLIIFFGVALIVARSGPRALAMWACLATIPVVILGTFGYSGLAIDIITSPSANIALAMGADSMIHLVVRVRRMSGEGAAHPWEAAVVQIGKPVLGATAIICAGFGIFALSSFPPTQRFGVAVIVGTLTAALMALVVLPRLASLRLPRSA